MIIVTPEQMQAIDRETIEGRGLPSLVLMENAARSVLPHIPVGRTAVLVGPGNNGGDGLVIARALWENGVDVIAVLFSETGSEDWAAQKALAMEWGVPMVELPGGEELENILFQSDVIVDALFGTGLDRLLEGDFALAVDCSNATPAFRLAVDIPSGINGRTGQVMGIAFQANRTVTFGHPKWGHVLQPGHSFTGELQVCNPGFHPAALMSAGEVCLTSRGIAVDMVPHNWPTMHKGDNGRLLLCTGSEQYPGAGILSTLGALRGGAGLVTHWAPDSLRTTLNTVVPEALLLNRDEEPRLPTFDAMVLGSGLGDAAAGLSTTLLREFQRPIVVDADALPYVSGLEREQRAHLILTPHPGEMAALLGCTVADIEENRLAVALGAAADLGCVVCLKGAPTIIASPDGRALVNSTGNAVLAQGGSGDVLAGLIGAYLSFGMKLFEATAGAAFVHGLAADLLIEEAGPRGVPASRIADFIPVAYGQLVG